MKYNMQTKQLITLACVLFISVSAMGQEQREINSELDFDRSVYPTASSDQRQIVIHLPAKEDLSMESNYKVELIGGKTMTVDCNRHGLDGSWEKKTVEGMGYTYYTFTSDGKAWSTMMGCPEESKHEAFVAAEPLMIDYNSRLPIVVYLPKGFELRYRIWTSGTLLDPDHPEYIPQAGHEALFQTWEWKSSLDSFTNSFVPLEQTGLSKRYTFYKDGRFQKFMDGEMTPGGRYRLGNDGSVFVKGKLPMIVIEGLEQGMSYAIEGNKLILTEERANGYKHTYVLKMIPKIQDCPDSIIENRMPMVTDPESKAEPTPSVYYIYKGRRHEVAEFDAEWVKKHCNVETQVVF